MSDDLEKKIIYFFKKNNIIENDKNDKNDKNDNFINKPNYFADEAFFLMQEFFAEFNIHKGYIDIDKFFNPLPIISLNHILNIFGLKHIKYPQKPKITIEHLIKVAKKNEWFDPDDLGIKI